MSDSEKTAPAKKLLAQHREATETLHRRLVEMHPSCADRLEDFKKTHDTAQGIYESDVLGVITTNG